eukprot:CAMPEP_0201490218 /NCGR_PEP_ID=MMETSP0151_2-20130828/25601_1 /ASSEMBLY_ACC=CAM_ASM_000257 /TAXON_ID=200890 /ORGANISM="Paramoeba atlantica, Strain 621/1 / CCAP 1560/9" /LENGTH=128 /DNA_ID=CAMNT_0047876085 /DNA_START=131 /DNA_END=514 /DNA_ORIENTATION=+
MRNQKRGGKRRKNQENEGKQEKRKGGKRGRNQEIAADTLERLENSEEVKESIAKTITYLPKDLPIPFCDEEKGEQIEKEKEEEEGTESKETKIEVWVQTTTLGACEKLFFEEEKEEGKEEGKEKEEEK